MTDIQTSLDSIRTANADVWQKVIALDVSYLQKRATTASNLNSTRWNTYLRRRYQLAQNPSVQCYVDRSEYFIIRQNLLNQKYGPISPPESNAGTITPTTETIPYNILLLDRQQRQSLSQFSTSSNSQPPLSSISLRKNENTAPVSAGYAFAGIETIFDHHKDSITRIRFAHNDSHLLAIASADGTASICRISQTDSSTAASAPVSHRIDYLQPPQSVSTAINISKNPIRYHPPGAIMDIAWSVGNDFVATASLDGSVCLWDINRQGALARHLQNIATPGGGLMVCEFHPVNNNYLILGDTMGLLQVLNLSTGRVVTNGRDKLHTPPRMRIKLPPCRYRTDLSHYLGRGCITALTIDPQTCRLWAGSDLGVIQAYSCNEDTGALLRLSQLTVFTPSPQTFLPSVTSLAFCAWLSHEDSSSYLLVNSAGVGLLLYRVDPVNGALELQHKFDLPHSPLCNPPVHNYGLHLLHSCFAPLISFRASGTACAISATEDKASIYVFEVLTASSERRQEIGRGKRRRSHSGALVTRLQGHDCEVGRTVIDVCLSWDESFLASADEAGMVILWKRQAEKTS